MKTNFLLKIFYVLFMLIGVQLAYADKLSFQFIYADSDIESVVFDHTTDPYYDTAAGNGQLSVSTTDPKQTPYEVTVDTDITKTGSTTIAGLFNESLGYTTSNNYTAHIVELGGAYNSHADNLDFRVRATLFINGESVVSPFYLAHNNKNYSDPSWWIGTLDGVKPAGLSLASLTVKTASGKTYCLNQLMTNYQVQVMSGPCDYPEIKFYFNHGKGVESLGFVPFESSAVGQIASITQVESNDVSILTFRYTPATNGTEIANSFNSQIPQNYGCGNLVGAGDVYSFELHVTGATCGNPPASLDFYVPGYFVINQKDVIGVQYAGDQPECKRVFVLAYGEGRWWLGTPYTPYDVYGGGMATYDNHINVAIPGDKYPLGFALKAVSDNSFTVYSSNQD